MSPRQRENLALVRLVRSPVRSAVLESLEFDERRVSDLASLKIFRRSDRRNAFSQVSKALRLFRENGLVDCRRGPDNKVASYYRITAKGRRALRELRETICLQPTIAD